MFSLAACSCPVLHMAGDLFCWPCACVFVLCEHMAFVLVFCVPCALMSIVLTPPILLPDYWLICPTCVYLVTLLICTLFNLLVFAVPCQFVIDVSLNVSCRVVSCRVVSCRVVSCRVVSCRVVSCPVLSCRAVPCPVLPASCPVFPLRGSFCCFVLFYC